MTMIRRPSGRTVPALALGPVDGESPEDAEARAAEARAAWQARVRALVGVPFRDGGRDAKGADCWGLVRLFMAEAGVVLPDYSETPAADLMAVARDVTAAAASETWLKVDRGALQPGDVVLLTARAKVDGRPRTLPGHVGVMIDSRRMLHVEESTASVVVPLGHPSVRNRLAGFFRHRSLA